MSMSLTDTVRAIDWELLREQKEQLLAMGSDEDRLTSEIEVLDGVVVLIDSIQRRRRS